ncbi:MAG: phosphate acyltransferase PlsX [Clostridia bacterium]|nr:phosphate acyltransferase PlsX [Clostridia bacterium]
MKIIVDAHGGDNAPLEILKGAADAVAAYGHDILLVGQEAVLRQMAQENGISLDKMEIVNTTDVITMEDHPKSILREHKDCSMAVALRLLAEGQGDAVVSAGSTGALLMGGTFLVKRLKGVSRPALAPIMPSDKEPYMLIDCGANADCRPEMLVQFAHMGSIYMSHMFPREGGPRVGLLNVGTEDTKGGELQLATFPLLKDSGLNFIGNVEARDVPAGVVDVVVADGFAGNVLLKTMEGTIDMLMKNLKQSFMSSLRTKIGAMLVMPGLRGLKKKLSTSEYGGAVLLGIAKPVVKAHGNSQAKGFTSAIRVAAEFAASGAVEEIEAVIGRRKEEPEV